MKVSLHDLLTGLADVLGFLVVALLVWGVFYLLLWAVLS